jgi:hypothetical protein
MGGTQTNRPGNRVAVRLDLAPRDRDRMERCAVGRGLPMSAYARQAVLAAIRADERAVAKPRD